MTNQKNHYICHYFETQVRNMKIENLHIRNIGPFKEANLEFNPIYDATAGLQPVTVITGVNGAGKSIVLDAIRCILSGQNIGRNIVADMHDFLIELDVTLDNEVRHLMTSTLDGESIKYAEFSRIARPLQYGYTKAEDCNDWILDYWSSNTPTDAFKITNMQAIDHKNVLKDAMLGKKSNVDMINFICQIDYLRTSEMQQERMLGDAMYVKLKEIINLCLDNGEFLYVRRSDLTPVIRQNGFELTFEKLSSGNLFLIQHLLLLMCKMYSVSVLRNIAPKDIFNISGLLLIDEIETHLHPMWQKKILSIIRKTFPNLQIILTTHSPFIVSSMQGIKIYTCKPLPEGTVIEDSTNMFSNMPVDEVLASEAFMVGPFNDEITALIHERRSFAEAGQKDKVDELEKKLYEINPEYFLYLKQ